MHLCPFPIPLNKNLTILDILPYTKMGGDSDNAKLQTDYDELVQKTDRWKAKVKELTVKDRQEIARLQGEVDTLNQQIETMGSIAREKDGQIAKRQSDVDQMRRTVEEATEKAASTHLLQDSLNNALTEKDSFAQQLRKREAEVQQLRTRVTDLSNELDATRDAKDGTAYFSEEARSSLKAVLTLTQGQTQWALCTAKAHTPRWFEVDLLRSKLGDALDAFMPEAYEVQLVQEQEARSAEHIERLTRALHDTQEEQKRVAKCKQDEIDGLLKRNVCIFSPQFKKVAKKKGARS